MPRWRSIVAVLAAAVLASSVLTGCGADPAGQPRLLTYSGTNNGAFAVAYLKTLSLNSSGCFTFDSGDVAVFPETWHVLADGSGVADAAQVIRVGDRLKMGGQESEPLDVDQEGMLRCLPAGSSRSALAGKGRHFFYAIDIEKLHWFQTH